MIGRTPSGRRDHVGVVAAEVAREAARDGARLRVTDDRVVLGRPAGPEVRVLGVPPALGEAQEVRPVVHAVVHDEQVRDGGRDVVRDTRSREVRRGAPGRSGRNGLLLVPVVRPLVHVLPRGADRLVRERAGRERGRPRLRGLGVVARGREGRSLRLAVHVPREARGEVLHLTVALLAAGAGDGLGREAAESPPSTRAAACPCSGSSRGRPGSRGADTRGRASRSAGTAGRPAS